MQCFQKALVNLPYPISTLKCKTFENTKMLKHRLESTFMEHKSYFSGWSTLQYRLCSFNDPYLFYADFDLYCYRICKYYGQLIDLFLVALN